MKKAVLFGASGFIGSYILDELLNNPAYELVTVVVRKGLNILHPKLKIVTGDYKTLPGLKGEIAADEIFIALGTTKKKTPDEKEYYQVDHDYPVLAAKIAKENGAGSVFLVSSVGANVNSSVFYLKTKGEMERDILALDFEHTHIFRPSMLMGDRKESRPMEKIFLNVWSAVNLVLIGDKMKRYRGILGKDLARAMVTSAKNQPDKVKINYWKDMMELLGEG
jgi:uncharacterized protein YbjT (DUF2867 family)